MNGDVGNEEAVASHLKLNKITHFCSGHRVCVRYIVNNLVKLYHQDCRASVKVKDADLHLKDIFY